MSLLVLTDLFPAFIQIEIEIDESQRRGVSSCELEQKGIQRKYNDSFVRLMRPQYEQEYPLLILVCFIESNRCRCLTTICFLACQDFLLTQV